MSKQDDRPAFHAEDGQAWRQWLSENHDKRDFIWLIIYKKDSGVPSVYINEALDEAVCFGWIDSKVNKRDDQSYYTYFSKRNPKSNWSRVNKNKVKRLINEGKMAEPGYAMIELAKETGTWNALDDVENLVVPDDLAQAFAKYNNAQTNFDAFPRSAKRAILEWIFNAKRATTRQKRIEETASLAEQNIRANQYKPK
ncbi:MAG: YdeI/OmpD-associated family protein [Saprospiraceae bacterium]|nr:YdeI/OmpD-associated family protein [Saprospiraceae bacterium]